MLEHPLKRLLLPSYRLALAVVLAALAGCAITAPPAAPTEAQQQVLARVQADYLAGHYGEVIRQVATSDELATAPASIQVPALKLQAFSYCVREYVALCEDTFVRILQHDPAFVLAPAEIGHPVWGPAYQRARRTD